MPQWVITKMKQALLPALILLVWFWCSRTGIWSTYVLPPPEKVWNTFWQMLINGQLPGHIVVSLRRVFTGYLIAFGLAFSFGVLAGVMPKQTVYYQHILEFLRQVPPISLIPLLIIWFGIGETSKLIIIVLAAFFPMFLNIEQGVVGCDAKLLEVGDLLGFDRWQKFFRIVLPAAVPDILVGMRIGMGYSWRAIIGAEMIAASQGLGYMILDAQQMSRSDKVMVGIVVIGIIGIICDWVWVLLMKKLLPGGMANERINDQRSL